MPRKRLGKQTKQEQISRAQFTEFISAYGWVASSIEPDLGEDFLVKIFRNGVPSGISLQVQLKSTKDINTLCLKDGRIRYRFDVDDMEHWDVEWPPVFIVVWDITIQKGWYIPVEAGTKRLHEEIPNWHNQKTITVYIPFENVLDKEHLQEIDRNLTQRIAPIILKDKKFQVKTQVSFPNDKEGQTKYREFKRFLDAGDPVQLDGKYITKWEVPDAWKRLYGEPDPRSMYVQIGPSKPEQIHPAQIEFSAPGLGMERIDYVEFYNVKHGREEFTLSNEKQPIPYKITFVINTVKHAIKLKMNIDFPKLDAIEAKRAMNIMRIMGSGGTITLKMLDIDSEVNFPFAGVPSVAPADKFIRFVENIYRIQLETQKKIFFREDGMFTIEDYNDAKELVSIIDSGTYSASGLEFNFTVGKLGVKQVLDMRVKRDLLDFKREAVVCYFDLMGTQFELGPMVQFIKGYWDMPVEEVNHWLSTAGEDDSLNIKLRDVELYEEFPNWMK